MADEDPSTLPLEKPIRRDDGNLPSSSFTARADEAMLRTIYSENPGPIENLAAKKAREINENEQALFYALMHNDQDRGYSDIVADFITFSPEEVAYMCKSYPDLSLNDEKAVRRQLAGEVLFRSKNQKLPEQTMSSYLHNYIGRTLRVLDHAIKMNKISFDATSPSHYLTMFDAVAITRILGNLSGHQELFLTMHDKAIPEIRARFEAGLKKLIQGN